MTMNGTLTTRFDANALQALNRALIGFDRIFDSIETQTSNNYPPHNVLRTGENTYEIQMAVAGFSKNELSVEVDQDHLIVRGNKVYSDNELEYLHRGLAFRDFEKVFPLAEYIEVGDVDLQNGLLCIKLTRIVPEALKPRSIEIKG